MSEKKSLLRQTWGALVAWAERSAEAPPTQQVKTYEGIRGSGERTFKKDAERLAREGWVVAHTTSHSRGLFGNKETITVTYRREEATTVS